MSVRLLSNVDDLSCWFAAAAFLWPPLSRGSVTVTCIESRLPRQIEGLRAGCGAAPLPPAPPCSDRLVRRAADARHSNARWRARLLAEIEGGHRLVVLVLPAGRHRAQLHAADSGAAARDADMLRVQCLQPVRHSLVSRCPQAGHAEQLHAVYRRAPTSVKVSHRNKC